MPIVDGKSLIGWGALRETPWHFVGLFASQEEAQIKSDKMGVGYIVQYGERQQDPDRFTPSELPARTAIVGSIFEPLPTADDQSGRLAAVAKWVDNHLGKERSEP